MKRLIPILLVAVVALTGCSNKNPYAGVYTGTFTFLNYDMLGSLTGNQAKEGKMQFLTNPLSNDLLLYSVIPLSSTTSTQYVSNSAVLDYVSTLLESIGNTNNVYNSITEKIKAVAITADFSGSSVHVVVQYEIEILGTLNTRITIVEFTGTR